MPTSQENPAFNEQVTRLIESMLKGKRVWTESGCALSMIWIKAMQGVTRANSPVDAMLSHAKTEAALNAMALAGGFSEREVQVLGFQASTVLAQALQRFSDLSAEGVTTMLSVKVDVGSTNQYFAAIGGRAGTTLH